MKKNLRYFAVLAFVLLPFAMYALEAEKYKLTNFKQVDETSFTFDLELHNTGDVAFGLDAAQCKIVYNQGIYGTESANIAQVRAVTAVSTGLVGFYGSTDGATAPTLGQLMSVTGNPGYIVFVTNALANVDYQPIDFFPPGAYKKLATIKVLFTTGSFPNPFVNRPFEEVLHNLAFDVNPINHTVNRVSVYNDVLTPGTVYKVGLIGAFTQMPQPTVENLPVTTANRLLARYCFTGSGSFTDAVRWNNATTSSVVGFNVVPPVTSNAIIAGACTISANTTVIDLTINGGGQLTLNSGSTALATNVYFGSDATTGTGTFVDLNATSSSGGLTVSGATNVQQYVTTGRNWYVSSPVASAPASIITGTTGNSLSSYVEPTASWITTDPSFTVAKGYVASVIPTNGNILFSGGALNTGLQTNSTLTRSVVASTGFNLVGNPYPSYVNWLLAQANSTNLEPTMWYRTKNNAVPSVYVFDTFNALPGIGTNNNGLGAVTGDIAPMQAFWVRIVPAQTTGSLALTNAMRSHQNQTIPSNRLKAPSTLSTQQVLRLKVSNGFNSDEAIVLFNPKAIDGYDGYDSGKMSNNNPAIPEIYTRAGNEKLVINGLNSVFPNEEIALGFTTGEDNTFTIKATEISNFADDIKIVLRDKLLNAYTELEPDYSYRFNSEKTTTDSRFSIVFKSISVATGLGNQDATGSESIAIFKNQEGLITVNRKDAVGEGTVTVCNAIGQVLTQVTTTGSVTVVDRSFIPGVYLVKVSVAGKNTTKRVILN